MRIPIWQFAALTDPRNRALPPFVLTCDGGASLEGLRCSFDVLCWAEPGLYSAVSGMGVTSSRIEDDKALLLCRERKHFVKQGLDGRCALAAAHVSYIQSLKMTGAALRKFVEPEVSIESSLCTSTSATPEPLALTEKSASQFSNSSPSFSQHVERAESVSPLPSSPYSGRFQVNYMKSNESLSKTVEERPASSVTATVHTSSDMSPKVASRSAEHSTFEDPAVNSRWDFFNMHPIDDQFSFHDSRTWNHGFENGDDIRRLREEEGIPELEEEEERASVHGMSECLESEDEFDQSSSEPLVRIFKNRNQMIEPHLVKGSAIPCEENTPLESMQKNEGRSTSQDGTCETVGNPDLAPGQTAPSTVTPLINGKKHAEKEYGSENRVAAKDLLSSIKEIESLFLKASESGKEVPRMLEADKVNFHPLFSEGKASKMKGSTFLTDIFVCCKEEIHISQEPATNDIKYLTWHRSVSSRSSSSRNPIGATSKDDIGDSSSTLFSNICMNSGSHASTLDRLYAWERKLYDEVKASGIIRRKYDMMCRQLRHQDSRGENTYKIDKTRAAVKDLHSRIRVALHRIDSISKKIEELRDKELHPQLEELIGGLFRMWEMMHEYHKLQYDIISVAYNNGNSKLLMQSEYHHQAAMVLEDELNGLASCFTKWIGAHKCYLQAINGWLLKCYFPVQLQKSRKGKSEFNPWRLGAPPIYVTCQHWLRDLDTLPTRELADAIKRLAVEATHSLPRQDKNNRKSNLPFSTPKIGGRQSLPEDARRNEDPVDWSLCLESLQKGLKSFLDQLKTFAEKSVDLYGNLRKATEEAKSRYENAPPRAQMLSMT